MLRRAYFLIILLSIGSCVPLEYVEPSGNPSATRGSNSRDFYHSNLNDPIKIAYENGASKGTVYYNIDDPYLDIVMQCSKSKGSNANADVIAKKDVTLGFGFYIAAQKAIMEDDLNTANEEINKAIELFEIQPFYDLKGSLYFLSGDTATANYYWNYLK